MIKIDNQTLQEIGDLFLEHIQDRTLKGLDKDNEPFKAYSTNKFVMPAAGVTKRARALLKKNGDLVYFQTKGGEDWILVNGYLALKKAIMAKTSYDGTVNLNLTGEMMRSFNVISVGNNSITLGFVDKNQADKAEWNIARGRDFLGLVFDGDLANDVRTMLLNGGLTFG